MNVYTLENAVYCCGRKCGPRCKSDGTRNRAGFAVRRSKDSIPNPNFQADIRPSNSPSGLGQVRAYLGRPDSISVRRDCTETSIDVQPWPQTSDDRIASIMFVSSQILSNSKRKARYTRQVMHMKLIARENMLLLLQASVEEMVHADVVQPAIITTTKQASYLPIASSIWHTVLQAWRHIRHKVRSPHKLLQLIIQ